MQTSLVCLAFAKLANCATRSFFRWVSMGCFFGLLPANHSHTSQRTCGQQLFTWWIIQPCLLLTSTFCPHKGFYQLSWRRRESRRGAGRAATFLCLSISLAAAACELYLKSAATLWQAWAWGISWTPKCEQSSSSLPCVCLYIFHCLHRQSGKEEGTLASGQASKRREQSHCGLGRGRVWKRAEAAGGKSARQGIQLTHSALTFPSVHHLPEGIPFLSFFTFSFIFKAIRQINIIIAIIIWSRLTAAVKAHSLFFPSLHFIFFHLIWIFCAVIGCLLNSSNWMRAIVVYTIIMEDVEATNSS